MLPINLLGGCRSHAHRASYEQSFGCTDDIKGSTCGDWNTPTLPTGMGFPRHNVPQYMGNGVWDARGVVLLTTAVGAMLGDPFQFARSPNLELLIRLLRGQETDALAEAFSSGWPLDDRYVGYMWSTETRDRLLNLLRQRFNRDYLTGSTLWSQLPAEIRQQLEQTPPSSLPEEVAACAAALLMDLDFASRSGADIWFLESMPDDARHDAHYVYHDEQTPSFWTPLFEGLGEDTKDPHGVLYTCAYQSTASGWYGGNMTTVFAPKNVPWGSGMDRFWLDRGCPGPTPRGRDTGDWNRAFCDRRAMSLDEGTNGNPDGGELRTPNYKTAAEIDGVILYPWHQWHEDALNDLNQHGGDMSSLVKATQWAIFRVPTPSRADAVPLAFVLAPGSLSDDVYGIEHRCCPLTFSASPSTPQVGKTQRKDGMEISVADRPWPSERQIPVWGVLYTCSRSNVLQTPWSAELPTERDRVHGCAAARALQEHAASLDAPTREAGRQVSVSDEIKAQLAALRVWSPDASVDLASNAATVSSPRPREYVCALTLAGLAGMMSTCGPYQ